jgi:hypothetical protein
MQKSLLTLVIAVILVLVSLTATSAAQPVLKSLSSLTVVDAHGVKVGELFGISANGNGLVAFEVDQQPLLLSLNANGFVFTSIFFLSGDCTGASYLRTSLNPATILNLFPLVAVSATGRVLYLPTGAAPLQDTSEDPGFMGSKFIATGACVPPTRIDEEQAWYIPVIPVIDLNTLFTPPFSVR